MAAVMDTGEFGKNHLGDHTMLCRLRTGQDQIFAAVFTR